MAELGVVASIVGIAAMGVSLSQKLYNLGSRTAHAGHNIHRVATTVTLFSSSLKHVAQVMEDSSSLHTPAAVDTAMQIVNECTIVFEEVGKILKLANGPLGDIRSQAAANDKKRRLSILQKVKWHFEQPKVDWLIAQLEYLKTTLSVLLQTLILAGVTAQAKSERMQSRESAEHVERERMHVETLIVARQLSLIVLNQFNQNTGKQGANQEGDGVANVSDAETDHTLEAPNEPKLLTQAGEDSASMLSLIKPGGNLEFLNRSMPSFPNQMAEDESMSPIMAKSSLLVDQLLGRWTRVNQSDEPNGQLSRRSTFDLEGQSDEALVHTPEGTSEDESNGSRAGQQTPEIKLQAASAMNGMSNGLIPIRTLDIRVPPQLNGNPFGLPPDGVRPPRPPKAAHSLPPPPQGRPVATRSVSTPMRPPSLDIPGQNPNVLGTLELPASPMASPATSPLSMSPVDRKQDQATTPKPSKIRVARGYSSSEESESEDEQNGNAGRRLYGLGIPWRIRIGPKYFDFLDASLVGPRRPGLPTESMTWIYSQDNAVTEISSKWVAEEAIAEARLAYSEMRPEDDYSNGPQQDYGWAGVPKHDHDLKWRVMQPLRFEKVQSLVERTIDLYRRRHPLPQSQNGSQPGVSSRPSSSHTNRGFLPVQPIKQNSFFSQRLDPMSPLKPVQRSVSFSNAPAGNSRDSWPKSRSGQFTPSPRLSPVADPTLPAPGQSLNLNPKPGYPPTNGWRHPSQGYGPPPPPPQNFNGHPPPPPQNFNSPPPPPPQSFNSPPPPTTAPREQFRPYPPLTPEQERERGGDPRRVADYERDYHREHFREDDWDREFDRDRHSHRDREHRSKGHSSKASTSSSSKAERERREAKKRQRSTAGTLARLGGLAALLEGLDGI